MKQIELIQPRVVCTLGNFATKLLSGRQDGISRVRGTPQVHRLGERTVFLYPIFHPAAALRTPAVREQLGEDFQRLPALLEERPPEPNPPPVPDPMPPAADLVGVGQAVAEPDQLGLF
jgi:DNA polymerase